MVFQGNLTRVSLFTSWKPCFGQEIFANLSQEICEVHTHKTKVPGKLRSQLMDNHLINTQLLYSRNTVVIIFYYYIKKGYKEIKTHAAIFKFHKK